MRCKRNTIIKITAIVLAAAFLWQNLLWADPDILSGGTLAPTTLLTGENSARALEKCVLEYVNSGGSKPVFFHDVRDKVWPFINEAALKLIKAGKIKPDEMPEVSDTDIGELAEKGFIEIVFPVNGDKLIFYNPFVYEDIPASALDLTPRNKKSDDKIYFKIAFIKNNIKKTLPRGTKIIPLGGVDKPGKSAFFTKIGEHGLLFDAGLDPQSGERLDLDTLEENSVDYILLSHSHIDHTGSLIDAAEKFPDAKIIATELTLKQAGVLLLDNAGRKNRTKKNGKSRRTLVNEIINKAIAVKSGTWYSIAATAKIKFDTAGHIPGACSVTVATPSFNLLYSGDISVKEQASVKPMEPPRIPIDFLLYETLYGDRPGTQNIEKLETDLAGVVNKTMKKGGILMIPSFALGRSAEIAIVLEKLMKRREIPEVPIYIDGMAAEMAELYDKYKTDFMPDSCRGLTGSDGRVFFGTDNHTIKITGRNRKRIFPYLYGREKDQGAIIICGHGMLSGGSSVNHVFMMSRQREPGEISPTEYYRKWGIPADGGTFGENNTIAIVGFPGTDTPSRKLLQIKKNNHPGYIILRDRYNSENRVYIKPEQIERLHFSAHSPGGDLADAAKNINPRKIALIHASRRAKEALKNRLIAEGFAGEIILPRVNEPITIPVPADGRGFHVKKEKFNAIKAENLPESLKNREIRQKKLLKTIKKLSTARTLQVKKQKFLKKLIKDTFKKEYNAKNIAIITFVFYRYFDGDINRMQQYLYRMIEMPRDMGGKEEQKRKTYEEFQKKARVANHPYSFFAEKELYQIINTRHPNQEPVFRLAQEAWGAYEMFASSDGLIYIIPERSGIGPGETGEYFTVNTNPRAKNMLFYHFRKTEHIEEIFELDCFMPEEYQKVGVFAEMEKIINVLKEAIGFRMEIFKHNLPPAWKFYWLGQIQNNGIHIMSYDILGRHWQPHIVASMGRVPSAIPDFYAKNEKGELALLAEFGRYSPRALGKKFSAGYKNLTVYADKHELDPLKIPDNIILTCNMRYHKRKDREKDGSLKKSVFEAKAKKIIDEFLRRLKKGNTIIPGIITVEDSSENRRMAFNDRGEKITESHRFYTFSDKTLRTVIGESEKLIAGRRNPSGFGRISANPSALLKYHKEIRKLMAPYDDFVDTGWNALLDPNFPFEIGLTGPPENDSDKFSSKKFAFSRKTTREDPISRRGSLLKKTLLVICGLIAAGSAGLFFYLSPVLGNFVSFATFDYTGQSLIISGIFTFIFFVLLNAVEQEGFPNGNGNDNPIDGIPGESGLTITAKSLIEYFMAAEEIGEPIIPRADITKSLMPALKAIEKFIEGYPSMGMGIRKRAPMEEEHDFLSHSPYPVIALFSQEITNNDSRFPIETLGYMVSAQGDYSSQAPFLLAALGGVGNVGIKLPDSPVQSDVFTVNNIISNEEGNRIALGFERNEKFTVTSSARWVDYMLADYGDKKGVKKEYAALKEIITDYLLKEWEFDRSAENELASDEPDHSDDDGMDAGVQFIAIADEDPAYVETRKDRLKKILEKKSIEELVDSLKTILNRSNMYATLTNGKSTIGKKVMKTISAEIKKSILKIIKHINGANAESKISKRDLKNIFVLTSAISQCSNKENNELKRIYLAMRKNLLVFLKKLPPAITDPRHTEIIAMLTTTPDKSKLKNKNYTERLLEAISRLQKCFHINDGDNAKIKREKLTARRGFREKVNESIDAMYAHISGYRGKNAIDQFLKRDFNEFKSTLLQMCFDNTNPSLAERALNAVKRGYPEEYAKIIKAGRQRRRIPGNGNHPFEPGLPGFRAELRGPGTGDSGLSGEKPLLTEEAPETGLNTVEDLEKNAKKIVTLLTNALMIWANETAPGEKEIRGETRERRVLAIDIGDDASSQVLELIRKYLTKPLKDLHSNNGQLEIMLKNMHIIIGNGAGLKKRLDALMTRPGENQLKKENTIIVTPEKNLNIFDDFKGHAFITAFDDSELTRGRDGKLAYYPIVEIAFFALLRILGSEPRKNHYDSFLIKKKKHLKKWYKRIPNIDLSQEDNVMRLCFDAEFNPKKTVILKLKDAVKFDHDKLEKMYSNIQEFIKSA